LLYLEKWRPKRPRGHLGGLFAPVTPANFVQGESPSIRTQNEPLSIVAVGVSNPDRGTSGFTV
jgi:hypothetical protein